MEKKTYIKPRTKKVFLAIEQLMLVASPGVGGGYNPHKPIESKGADFLGLLVNLCAFFVPKGHKRLFMSK